MTLTKHQTDILSIAVKHNRPLHMFGEQHRTFEALNTAGLIEKRFLLNESKRAELQTELDSFVETARRSLGWHETLALLKRADGVEGEMNHMVWFPTALARQLYGGAQENAQ